MKPDPAALLHIADTWKTEPSRLIMVGDDEKDILCGKSAGASNYHIVILFIQIAL